MFVTFTVGRLGMLPGQCASWGGVLSAAIYVGHIGNAATSEAAEANSSAADAVHTVFNECVSPAAPCHLERPSLIPLGARARGVRVSIPTIRT